MGSFRYGFLVFALLILGAGGPLFVYAMTLGRAPAVTAAEAHGMLGDSRAMLVDVSWPEGEMPLRNGTAWPLPAVLAMRSRDELPVGLRDRPLVLLCPGGIQSAEAAMHLRSIGVAQAWAVRGGEQEWIATTPGCTAAVRFSRTGSDDAAIPGFRAVPAAEQFAAVFTFFGLKFVYTLISAGLIVVLWKERALDLAALRWSMVAFFIGEACCFFNVMVFFEDSALLEHLHSVGMVVTFALAVWAALEFVDARLIHVSDAGRCAAMALCRGCVKQNTAACGARRVFLLLIPATALLALLPLFSSFRHLTYNTRIYGVLHAYSHGAIHQVYELRVLPVLALALLVAAFFVLLFRERHPAPVTKVLFAAAAGALGFSYFRLLLLAAFIDHQVWSDAWEETTELMFVGLVAAVLMLFRRALLARSPA